MLDVVKFISVVGENWPLAAFTALLMSGFIYLIYIILQHNVQVQIASISARLEEIKDDRKRLEAIISNNTAAMTHLSDTVQDLKEMFFQMMGRE